MIGILVAGLTLGLIGSLHCVGMCGPLVLGLPLAGIPSSLRWLALGIYHTGRVVMYSFIGVLFGLAGRGFYLAGFQRSLSIILGIAVLALGIAAVFKIKLRRWRWSGYFQDAVQLQMLKLLRWGKLPGFAALGMLNALLPCGMVYLAIAGAMGASGIIEGGLFMFSFGAGTVPALFALSFAGFRADPALRKAIRKATPLVMGLMGALLVLRGLNLGIPFLSPLIDSPTPESVICH